MGALWENSHRADTRITIDRDHIAGGQLLWKDYFCSNPTYPAETFRRRYRMRRELFNRILEDVVKHNPYFVEKRDVVGVLGLNPHQKLTSSIRMLAYGCAAEAIDEYLRIGETTVLEATRKFYKTIVQIYGKEYLQSPTRKDVDMLLNQNNERGFPGMLGSIDCMHWKWDKCPSTFAGAYTSYKGDQTIVLEAVVSFDLWFWHAFFGMPGSHNNINVMNRSYIFRDLVNGRAPPVNFVVNGNRHNIGYYLGDAIYPKYLQLSKQLNTQIHKKKSGMQEGARKDVERGFGVLQLQWAIVKQPARMWNPHVLAYVMKTCIILHNMIVEDERIPGYWPYEYEHRRETPPVTISRERSRELQRSVVEARRNAIGDKDMHFRLRDDLIEHLWDNFGEN